MADVAVYVIPRHRRSAMCCEAMFAGISAAGDRPKLIPENAYHRPSHQIAVFYGYTPTLRRVMADYIRGGGKAVYIDLGYWNRIDERGHHKIAVNARHPTDYFMRRPMDDKRVRSLGLGLLPWRRPGGHILIAGMGAKAAEAEGKRVEQWEREAITELAKVTPKRLIYRPKPSWTGAKPIAGAEYSPKEQSLNALLTNCHAVVTHHSNAAVEAIAAGIPAFCWKGVAAPLSLQDLSRIDEPFYPENRSEWLNAISYCQWSVAEMHQGLPWRHLKDEGLI
jgi:hypothetical protein